jgi:hypothetical protein
MSRLRRCTEAARNHAEDILWTAEVHLDQDKRIVPTRDLLIIIQKLNLGLQKRPWYHDIAFILVGAFIGYVLVDLL